MLGLLGLTLAVVALFDRLGTAASSDLRAWINSDTLYPVHVTIDVVRDGFAFEGWKFSIAPCWFPDLFLAGVFWIVSRSAVIATLLAGAAQLPLVALAFAALQKSCGTRFSLGAVAVLATATVLVLAPKVAAPGLSGMELNRLLLPQSHVGGLVNSLLALGLGTWLVRIDMEGGRRLALGSVLAALCVLAGMSNVMFFVQALVPLTAALLAAGLLRRIAWAHSWRVLAISWPTALLGAFLNRTLFDTTSLANQARISLPRAWIAAVVFWQGFSGQLRAGEPLHWLAVLWVAFALVLVVRAHVRARRSTGPAATNATLEGVMYLSLVLSAVASCAANILGGNTGLVESRDYLWVTHYLLAVFFTPIFAVPFALALVCERHAGARLISGLTWGVALLAMGSGAVALAAQPAALARLRDYRPALVEFMDRLATQKGLHDGVAGYWQARPITLLSRTGLRANQIGGTFEPMLWVSNRYWYTQQIGNHRERPPLDFVILDDPMWRQTRERAVAKFGPPVDEVSFQGTRVLIYKGSGAASP